MEGTPLKKTLIAMVAASILFGAVAAQAAESTMMGGLGFRTLQGPANQLVNSTINFGTSPAIGIREWMTDKVGLDVAVGFTSLSVKGGTPQVKGDEGTGFVIDAGLPLAAKKWDKVTFIFRPGILYGTAKAKDKLSPTAPNEFTTTLMSVTGELEVEYWIADKLSISAAHGVAYRSLKAEDNSSPKNEVFSPSITSITSRSTRSERCVKISKARRLPTRRLSKRAALLGTDCWQRAELSIRVCNITI